MFWVQQRTLTVRRSHKSRATALTARTERSGDPRCGHLLANLLQSILLTMHPNLSAHPPYAATSCLHCIAVGIGERMFLPTTFTHGFFESCCGFRSPLEGDAPCARGPKKVDVAQRLHLPGDTPLPLHLPSFFVDLVVLDINAVDVLGALQQIDWMCPGVKGGRRFAAGPWQMLWLHLRPLSSSRRRRSRHRSSPERTAGIWMMCR